MEKIESEADVNHDLVIKTESVDDDEPVQPKMVVNAKVCNK